LQGIETPAGPTPPNYIDQQISLLTPIYLDIAPTGEFFGSVKVDPFPLYTVGETVKTVFVSGNPRNNPMRGGSFLLVERRRDDMTGWEVVATDADWSTK
jgi:neutral ceramidase